MRGAILCWITTLVASLLFVVPGAAPLAGYPHFISDMAMLGYPNYFSIILGISKLAAVAAILARGLPKAQEMGLRRHDVRCCGRLGLATDRRWRWDGLRHTCGGRAVDSGFMGLAAARPKVGGATGHRHARLTK